MVRGEKSDDSKEEGGSFAKREVKRSQGDLRKSRLTAMQAEEMLCMEIFVFKMFGD